MAVLLGNDLIVWESGTPIAGATSCTVNYDAETIEVSSPDTGSAKTYIVGRTSWKITLSYIVCTNDSNQIDVADSMLKVGNTYTLTFGARSKTAERMTGTAICTGAKVTGQRFNITSGSFEFIGSGVLENANFT